MARGPTAAELRVLTHGLERYRQTFAKDKEAATAALKAAIPVIDKAAAKGVIHSSNASRNVSRLTKLVNTIA